MRASFIALIAGLTVPAGYRRVELDVIDSESRTGRITVSFQSL